MCDLPKTMYNKFVFDGHVCNEMGFQKIEAMFKPLWPVLKALFIMEYRFIHST